MAARRKLCAALAVAATAVGLGSFDVAVSQAYSHNQTCSKPAYEGCYDVQGQIYNPWTFGGIALNGLSGGNPAYSGTCIKAVTQAGNNKSGDRCSGSSTTTTNFQASPTSQVYGYWGGSGGTFYVFVQGQT